jgi:Flp pilus assembly pilin Flp
MKSKRFLRKATNSFVGRVLRRLIGEEKGVVMMEYIVVGLLIAAEAVVAVGAFGGGITNMFGALTATVVGESTDARANVDSARADAKQDLTKSDAHRSHIRNDGDYQNTAATTEGF